MKNKKKIEDKQKVKRTLKKIAPLLVIMLLCMATMAYAAGAPQSTAVSLQVLPVLPTSWIGIAVLFVLIIILIAVIVYMLSGILDSPNARAWARAQIYEGILSVIIILVFLFVLFFFFQNPAFALSAVNLMPGQIVPGTSAPFPSGEFNCLTQVDIFQIATCNVAVFNHFGYSTLAALFNMAVYLGFMPGLGVQLTFFPGTDTNTDYSGSANIDSLLPIEAETNLQIPLNGLIILFILNQIQLLLLAGSVFWLAFFVSLGVIARAFGFMKTFGGAMIALGIGLGLVYPLVVSITYGYINYQLSYAGTTGFASGQPLDAYNITYQIYNALTNCALVFFSNLCIIGGSWVYPMALIVGGLTFIPFLNFTIVDSFIVDFSKAIGERLDFMTLLIGII